MMLCSTVIILSGIVPEYTIGIRRLQCHRDHSGKPCIDFYGIDPSDPTGTVDPETAQASPVMEAYIPYHRKKRAVGESWTELLETDLRR